MRSAPPEVRPAEVRLAEVRPAEVRPAEVRLAEVRPAEVRPGEVGVLNGRVCFPPSVLGRSALLKDLKLLLVGHDLASVPSAILVPPLPESPTTRTSRH